MADVPTSHCASCGAPVQDSDLQCRYCGSQLADLACPQCFAHAVRGATHCSRCGASLFRGEGAPAPGSCPECRVSLQVRQVGSTPVFDCPRCGGLWLARETFEHLVSDREQRQSFLGTPAAPQTAPSLEVRYRPCPACKALMNRSNYARVSGVIVDTCKEHGVWFDRDELGRVLRFIEQGGLLKAAEREHDDLKAERERLKEQARNLAAMPESGHLPSGALEASLVGHLLDGAAWILFDR